MRGLQGAERRLAAVDFRVALVRANGEAVPVGQLDVCSFSSRYQRPVASVDPVDLIENERGRFVNLIGCGCSNHHSCGTLRRCKASAREVDRRGDELQFAEALLVVRIGIEAA